MDARYLTLKDMTRATGCTARTVRYYEREGLLHAVRSAGGHRLFPTAQLERLSFIISLREAGWSLEEVEAFLSVRDDARTDRQAAERLDGLLAAHIERLGRKMAVLARLREDLEGTQALLSVCSSCTVHDDRIECSRCERVPPLDRLPRGFRLGWRARELADATVPAFDEGSVAGLASDDGDDDAGLDGLDAGDAGA